MSTYLPKRNKIKKKRGQTVIKVILVVVILKYRPKCMLLIILCLHGIPCKSDVLFKNKNKDILFKEMSKPFLSPNHYFMSTSTEGTAVLKLLSVA